MIGQSSIDTDVQKYLARSQNLEISSFPSDKHYSALMFQIVGEQYFLNCCLRKLAPLLSSVVENLKSTSGSDARTQTLAHIDDNLYAITEIAQQHAILLLNLKNASKYGDDSAWSQFGEVISNRREEYLFEDNKIVKSFQPYNGLFLDPRKQQDFLENKKLIRLRAQKRKREQQFEEKRSKTTPPDSYICHTCNKKGHWRRDCPQNKSEIPSKNKTETPSTTPISKN